MPDLPIYELQDAMLAELRSGNRLILQAPTGSGKSTQVPQILLEGGVVGEGEIVVLQPRRLATRMLAARVAQERGSRLGGEVGYQIRLDKVTSKETRIRFVTEGVLLRQLLADPRLGGISVVVFDEFHERHLYGDITLARVLELQEQSRPDLKIVVMSGCAPASVLLDLISKEPISGLAWAGRAKIAIAASETAKASAACGSRRGRGDRAAGDCVLIVFLSLLIVDLPMVARPMLVSPVVPAVLLHALAVPLDEALPALPGLRFFLGAAGPGDRVDVRRPIFGGLWLELKRILPLYTEDRRREVVGIRVSHEEWFGGNHCSQRVIPR